jgi:hypothetical protein
MWFQCGSLEPVTRGGNTGFKKSDHNTLKYRALEHYCTFLSTYMLSFPRRLCPKVCFSENLMSHEVNLNSVSGVDFYTKYQYLLSNFRDADTMYLDVQM